MWWIWTNESFILVIFCRLSFSPPLCHPQFSGHIIPKFSPVMLMCTNSNPWQAPMRMDEILWCLSNKHSIVTGSFTNTYSYVYTCVIDADVMQWCSALNVVLSPPVSHVCTHVLWNQGLLNSLLQTKKHKHLGFLGLGTDSQWFM